MPSPLAAATTLKHAHFLSKSFSHHPSLTFWEVYDTVLGTRYSAQLAKGRAEMEPRTQSEDRFCGPTAAAKNECRSLTLTEHLLWAGCVPGALSVSSPLIPIP